MTSGRGVVGYGTGQPSAQPSFAPRAILPVLVSLVPLLFALENLCLWLVLPLFDDPRPSRRCNNPTLPEKRSREEPVVAELTGVKGVSFAARVKVLRVVLGEERSERNVC